MENNFTYNPLGQSFEGKEGSGLAQVFQPYSAGKFEMAKAEHIQAQAAQKAKEEAEAKKNFKLPELTQLDKPWEIDVEHYSKEVNDFTKEEEELISRSYDLKSETTDFDEKSVRLARDYAAHNTKGKRLGQKLYMSFENKDAYEKASDEFAKNPDNYDGIGTTENLSIYSSPESQQWLMDEAGGNREVARQIYRNKYNNGSLLVDRFKHIEELQKPLQEVIAQTAKDGGWGDVKPSDMGGYMTITNKTKNFDEKQERNIVLNAITNDTRALRYFRDNEILKPQILEYANVDDIKKVPLKGEKSVYSFMAETDGGLQFMRDNYFLKDESQTTKSFQQDKDLQGGFGLSVDSNGNPVPTELTNPDAVVKFGNFKLYTKSGKTTVYGANNFAPADLQKTKDGTFPVANDWFILDENGMVVDNSTLPTGTMVKEISTPINFGAYVINWSDNTEQSKTIAYRDEDGVAKTKTIYRNGILPNDVAEAYSRGDVANKDITVEFTPAVGTQVQSPSGDKYSVVSKYDSYPNLKSDSAQKYREYWITHKPSGTSTQPVGESGMEWK